MYDLSKRFIKAYNSIDRTLRNIYKFKPSMPFGDMIRTVGSQNSLIRKFEEELMLYSRLRNAIVHNTDQNETIAEPHQNVVEKLESISLLVSSPPLVADVMEKQRVITASADETVKNMLLKISKRRFSNIPVESGERIIGLLNAKDIVATLGSRLQRKLTIDDDFLEKTLVRDVIDENDYEYMFASSNLTIVDAVNYFNQNRSLKALLITRLGDNIAPVICIVTASNIMDFNTIIDKY